MNAAPRRLAVRKPSIPILLPLNISIRKTIHGDKQHGYRS